VRLLLPSKNARYFGCSGWFTSLQILGMFYSLVALVNKGWCRYSEYMYCCRSMIYGLFYRLLPTGGGAHVDFIAILRARLNTRLKVHFLVICSLQILSIFYALKRFVATLECIRNFHRAPTLEHDAHTPAVYSNPLNDKVYNRPQIMRFNSIESFFFVAGAVTFCHTRSNHVNIAVEVRRDP